MRKNFSLLLLLVVAADLSSGQRRGEDQAEPRSYKPHGGGYGPPKKPHPVKCHPQTLTKYKTIYKDRKANVFNQVEILNPRPHVKKVTETRHTTIRYPVFITQVIKPLLTQVETKVKPIFFTKTITRYSSVLFTVTGIGQVTVTKVKHEKEYVTRCQKKGYHRRNYEVDGGPELKELVLPLAPYPVEKSATPTGIPPPAGIPYQRERPDPRTPYGNSRERQRVPPYSHLAPLLAQYEGRPGASRRRRPGVNRGYSGNTGNVENLYLEDFYYGGGDQVSRSGRALEDVTFEILEPVGETVVDIEETLEPHPPLESIPLTIIA